MMALEMGMVLAVLSLIGWGLYPVMFKKVIDKLGSYTCMVFNHIVLVVLVLFTAIFTIKLKMPSDYVSAALLVGGIVGAVAVYLFYKAINEGDVSTVAVIAAIHVIWVAILSYFIFNEHLVVMQYVVMAVTLFGALMIAMKKPGLPKKFNEKHTLEFLKSDIWSKGAGLALLASFCWAFYNLISMYAVSEVGVHRTTVYLETFVLLFILTAFVTRSHKKLVKLPGKNDLKWLLPSALLFSLGAIGFYFALSLIPLQQIVPITSLAPAVSVIAAIILLKERLRAHQYIGIIIVLVGIFLLVR